MRRPSWKLILAVVVLGACSGGELPTAPSSTGTPNTPTLASITVALNAQSLVVGQTTQASATLVDANGGTFATQSAVTWSSSNTSTATVNSAGLVTAVAAGTVTISASLLAKTGSATLTVTSPVTTTPPPSSTVASVAVSLAKAQIFTQQATLATAVLKDAAGNVVAGSGTTWTSSNEVVAFVSPTGVVSGLAIGSATITATSDGQAGSVTITVVAPPPVASVSVIAPATVGLGNTAQASVVLKDAAANVLTGRAIQWSSSNIAVAAVNGTGMISAATLGAATITATSEGVTGASTVTVVPPTVASVVVAAPVVIAIGVSAQATFATADSAGHAIFFRTPTWSSQSPAIATVSSTGVVTGVSAGTAGIAATVDGVTGVLTVKIVGGTQTQQPAQLALTTQPFGALSGAAFVRQPVIEVRDAANQLVPSATGSVTAAVSSGTGTLSGTVSVPVVNGAATFTNLAITGSGPHTLTFTSGTLSPATSNSFPVSLPPSQVSIAVAPLTTTGNGLLLPLQPSVQLLDANNLPASFGGVVVTVSSVPVGTATATLSGPTTAVTNASGVATFANLRLTGGGAAKLVFSSPGLASATSPNVTVVPLRLAIVTQPAASAKNGAVFATQPVIQVRDSSNNAVAQAAVVVTAAVASGGAALGGSVTMLTDVNGVARYTDLAITGQPGSRTLSFTAPLLVGATSTPIAITVGAPFALADLTQPSSAAQIGVTLPQQPVVQVVDAGGSPVPNSGVPIQATTTNNQLAGVINAFTAGNGSATFKNLGFIGTTGQATITFSSPGLVSATSSSVAVGVAPSSDEPVFDPKSQTMRMQDNMDGYTTLTAMGAVAGAKGPRIVPNPSPFAVSQPVDATRNAIISPGRNGSAHALRMSYPGGPAQASAVFYTVNNVPTPASTAHYFQYWARIDFGGPLSNPFAVKWFEAWHVKLDRIQWNTHDHLPCPAALSPTYWQVYDQGKSSVCQGNQPYGPYPFNVNDAQWHRYTYAYRMNSAKGARDGFARMWVDGVKVIDISLATMGIVPPGGEKPWCSTDDIDNLADNDPIDHVEWGSTQTTNTQPWTYDIDDFFWWTSP